MVRNGFLLLTFPVSVNSSSISAQRIRIPLLYIGELHELMLLVASITEDDDGGHDA